MGFHAYFLHGKPIFFSLLAIFFVLLSLENSQKEKENRMSLLKRTNPGSFWLGAIIKTNENINLVSIL